MNDFNSDDPQFQLMQRKLASYDWRRLLRHVLCPAQVHVKEAAPTDFAAMFFHEMNPEDIARYQGACEIPGLLCGDFESGTGFPSMFGMGMAGDADLAYTMGKGVALQKRRLGFNWTLAPVCDIALDIDSPMVGLRAAGETADQVIPVTTGYLRGLQDHGMAATAKHFPGDGFNSLDQHVTTPVNRMTEPEWRATYGRTFGAAIEAGVACIMPGHLGLAWAEKPDSRNGVHPPATVSKRLLTGLVREEMGFSGVIVSDAMGMGGVAGFMNPYDSYAAFLEAGGDILLFARYDGFLENEIERCLREGKLKEETLYLRALNVLRLKQSFGLFEEKSEAVPEVATEEWDAAGLAATAKAVRVVRDLPKLLPLAPKPGGKILHLYIGNHPDDAAKRLEDFSDLLAAESGGEVTFWCDPGPEKLFFALREKPFDLVVASLWNQPDYGANVLRLHGPVARNMMDGWMHLGTPVVFVQHGYPFHYRHYPAAMETVISTYGFNKDSLPLVTELIFKKKILL